MRCPDCDGVGYVLIVHRPWFGTYNEPCPTCHGSGITSCCSPDHVPDMTADSLAKPKRVVHGKARVEMKGRGGFVKDKPDD